MESSHRSVQYCRKAIGGPCNMLRVRRSMCLSIEAVTSSPSHILSWSVSTSGCTSHSRLSFAMSSLKLDADPNQVNLKTTRSKRTKLSYRCGGAGETLC